MNSPTGVISGIPERITRNNWKQIVGHKLVNKPIMYSAHSTYMQS